MDEDDTGDSKADRPSQYKDGNRNRQVNFLSAAKGEGFPKMIEFRSARGHARC